MSSNASGTRPGFFRRLIPPTPMSRRLATQSMLFSTGEGAFNTGSAVFLTQVVGMSAARVGLALTITGVAEFLMAYPAGRIVDRFGPKRVWALTTWGRSASSCRRTPPRACATCATRCGTCGSPQASSWRRA
jgi:predicted MFS family arabinose efflux permease